MAKKYVGEFKDDEDRDAASTRCRRKFRLYSREDRHGRVRRHLGSSIALLLGCLGFSGGLSTLVLSLDNRQVGTPGTLIGGAVMILGALAYRSAKKRKLGEAKSTLTRQFLEIASLVMICFAILMQNNFKYLIATDPVPNAVIPIWAIVAYVVVALMPKRLLQRPSL